jgi:hypothetical protein
MLALVASAATAQDQPRGRGRGGFGGGGFGGPGMNSPVALLGIPEVRKELNVSDEQGKEIDDVLAKVREARGGFNFQDFQSLGEDERQKRMDEMRKKGEEADKAAQEKLDKILKPEQLARLNQLSLQRQGLMALARPEVAKQLGLSQEQQDKIKKIQDESRPQPRGFGQNLSDEERQKLFAERQERQEKAQAETLAVLTDDQKTKWTELKGKEFDFPAFGGPGGGGGPGGPRRRPATKQ